MPAEKTAKSNNRHATAVSGRTANLRRPPLDDAAKPTPRRLRLRRPLRRRRRPMLPTAGCVPTRSCRHRSTRPARTERESATPSLRGLQRRARSESIGSRANAPDARSRQPPSNNEAHERCYVHKEPDERNVVPSEDGGSRTPGGFPRPGPAPSPECASPNALGGPFDEASVRRVRVNLLRPVQTGRSANAASLTTSARTCAHLSRSEPTGADRAETRAA
jgi:hypothetical protein